MSYHDDFDHGYNTGLEAGRESCAAGPWHKSSDTPPPKNGRWILGIIYKTPFTVRWNENIYGFGWQQAETPCGQFLPAPSLWAEINEMPKGKP